LQSNHEFEALYQMNFVKHNVDRKLGSIGEFNSWTRIARMRLIHTKADTDTFRLSTFDL